MKKNLRMAIFTLVVVGLVFAFSGGPENHNYTLEDSFAPPVVFADTEEACVELMQKAFFDAGENCSRAGVNNACFGYEGIDTSFLAAKSGTFEVPGDRIPLDSIESLATAALNLEAETYGVAVLNLQANYHTAVAEAAVMVMIGNVHVENAVPDGNMVTPTEAIEAEVISETSLYSTPGSDAFTAGQASPGDFVFADVMDATEKWVRVFFRRQMVWMDAAALDLDTGVLPVVTDVSLTPMQAFNFRSGQNTSCLAGPPPVIMLQSPDDMPFRVVVNGATIEGAATVFLRTIDDSLMRVAVGEGAATVFAGEVNEVTVPVGYSVDVQLNVDGQTVGSWSGWDVAAEELNQYIPFKELPPSMLNGPYSGPQFFQTSGIGEPPPILPGEVDEPIYTPVPFPHIDLSYGELGEDLPRGAFTPITVGAATCPDWLFYHSDEDGDWDVYRLQNSGQTNNVSNGNGSGDINPGYSQDGQWVVFTSNRVDGNNWELFIASADGTEIQRITYNTGNDINPAWGPDGKIIFESNRDGDWELFLIDVTVGLDLTQITDDPANDVNTHWLRNQEAILYQNDQDGDWEIFQMDVSARSSTQLTDNTVEDIVPVGSHDENTMAWLQQSPFGVYDLWSMDLETRETEQLTDTGTTISSQVFSTDDTFLAYHTRLDGDFDVFAQSLDDRDSSGEFMVENVSDDQSDTVNDGFEDRAPTIRCDGPMIVFHSNRIEMQQDLYQINPLPIDGNSGSLTRLTDNELAYEIFPLADPRDEINSRQSDLPVHP